MKKFTKIINAGIFGIALSQATLASAGQRVCLSNGTQPKHCKAGDILVVSPEQIATSCDFRQQIVKLKPSKTATEFLCTYTGNILKIRPNTSKPPQPPMQMQQPRPRKKSFFW